jgi:translation initiation factor 2 alpha subunit (eIF-2alpha)
LEHGADLGEGGFGPHHGDEGGLLVEVFTEPDEEYVDELAIVDGITELAKFVSDGLEPLTVDADGRINLNGVAKLGVEAVEAGVDVVLKKLTKRRP